MVGAPLIVECQDLVGVIRRVDQVGGHLVGQVVEDLRIDRSVPGPLGEDRLVTGSLIHSARASTSAGLRTSRGTTSPEATEKAWFHWIVTS